MKLLYIANGFGYAKGISGGPTRVYEIGKRLQKLGADVSILTTTTGYEQLKGLGLNVRYYILPPTPGLEKMEQVIIGRAFSYLVEIIKAFSVMTDLRQYDIIYTSSDYLCDTMPAWICKKFHPGIRWVAFIHHLIDLPWRRKGNPLVNFLSYLSQQVSLRLMRNRADFTLLLGTPEGWRLKSYLSKPLHVSPEKIVFTVNGVDTKLIESVPEQDKLYDAFCSIALQAIRGGSDIVPIWKQVCMRKSDAHLLVIARGSPKLVHALKVSLEREGLTDNVELMEYVPRETYIRLIKSSKVYFAPKYEEGWGIGVCEAMACGVPAVTYNLPAYEIFRDAVVKVPIGNRTAFARAILRLLSDEKLRKVTGRKGEDVASRFDWDKIAKEELGLLRGVSNQT